MISQLLHSAPACQGTVLTTGLCCRCFWQNKHFGHKKKSRLVMSGYLNPYLGVDVNWVYLDFDWAGLIISDDHSISVEYTSPLILKLSCYTGQFQVTTSLHFQSKGFMETTVPRNFDSRSTGVAAERAGKDAISSVTPPVKIHHFSHKGKTPDIVIPFSCTLNLQSVISPTSLTLQKVTPGFSHFPQSSWVPQTKIHSTFQNGHETKSAALIMLFVFRHSTVKILAFSFTLLIWLSKSWTL